MVLPPYLTEADVLQAIEKAVGLLAHSFTFGFYDLDDIRQEARVMGLEALPRYDPGGLDADGKPRRALANFLYVHIKNRLTNLRRDKYRRNDPPCRLCHEGRQAEHPGGAVCPAYAAWKGRNAAKANLMRPADIDRVADEREPALRARDAAPGDAAAREAEAMIDRHLPAALRPAYLRLRAGEAVPKDVRQRLEAELRAILRGYAP